jgi:phospholipid/cholesterol/gamma-HCH transport system substrate-binding protein
MVQAKEMTVGILFFSALVAMGFLTILLSDIALFHPTYEYDVFIDEANDIRIKDQVLIMGTQQGKVTNIEFFPEPVPEPVLKEDLPIDLWVKLTISMKIPLTLKEDYSIRIRNATLLGGKVVAIRLGKSKKALDPLPDHLVGMAVRDPVEAISEFVETNKVAVRNTVENIDQFIANLTLWSDHVNQGKGLLGELIFNQDIADGIASLVSGAEAFIVNLNSDENTLSLLTRDPVARERFEDILVNLKNISSDIAEGTGTVGKLIKDPHAHDKLVAVLDDMEAISDKLEKGEGLAGKLLSEASDKTYDDVAKIAENLRLISDGLVEGEGLLASLIFDRSLKVMVHETMARIDNMIKDVEEGKGPLGVILRNEDLSAKIIKIADHLLGSLEDAREAAPLSSLGTFLFGAI